MKVIGVSEINYVSKTTQKPVHGYEIYGSFPSKNCLYGEKTSKEYLSAFIVEQNGGVLPQVGDEFEVVYNKYGAVKSYTVNSK